MFSGFSKILASTAASVEKAVQTTVHDVTGPKALQDFELGEQIGSGGPGLLWKLYRATPISDARKAVFPEVCVWFLDKRALAEDRARRGNSKAAEETLLDIFRAECKALQKLRHPGVVRVIEPLDESKGAMAMVTEPIFSSLANALGCTDNISTVPQELEKLDLGQLEVKQGLMQLSEALSFIHRNARLIHRGISPESVFITTNGGWKFAGFGFSTSAEDNTSPDEPPFIYPDYDVEQPVLPLQPPLDYTAPELTRPMPLSARTGGLDSRLSVDLYSMGLLAYHTIVKRPLLRCQNNLETYHSKVPVLTRLPFNDIPMDLEPELRRMLNMDPSGRLTASDFTGSRFFTEDPRLKALHFLDEMIGRGNDQRAEFLNSLASIWSGFDSRILRFKVLPPLLNELKNPATQLLALPWVLEVVEVQDANDFQLRTQTLLIPAMEAARGELLLLFLRHMPALMAKASASLVQSHLLPMLMRAFEDPDPRLQEETLRRGIAMVPKLDFALVKEGILPRIHMLALQSSVAAVRAQALASLGELVPSLDRAAVMDILQTCARCSANDHSPTTIMCIVGVADIIRQGYGMEFTAQFIVPILSPLLTIQQLSNAQFARLLKLIMDVLTQLQDKRGVSLSEADSVSLDLAAMGLGSASANGDVPSAGKRDEWETPSSVGSVSVPNVTSTGPTLPPPSSSPSLDPFAPREPQSLRPAPSVADPFASMPPLGGPSPSFGPSSNSERSSPLTGPSSFGTPSAAIAAGGMPTNPAPPFALSSSSGGSPLPNFFSNAPPPPVDPFASSSWPAPPSAGNVGLAGPGNLGTAPVGMNSTLSPQVSARVGMVSLVPDQPPPADDPFADWPPRKPAGATSAPNLSGMSAGMSSGMGAGLKPGMQHGPTLGTGGASPWGPTQPLQSSTAFVGSSIPAPGLGPSGTTSVPMRGSLSGGGFTLRPPPSAGSLGMLAPPPMAGYPSAKAATGGNAAADSPTLYPSGPTLLPTNDPFNLL